VNKIPPDFDILFATSLEVVWLFKGLFSVEEEAEVNIWEQIFLYTTQYYQQLKE